MTILQRSVCLMGLAAALVLPASGCADYTYFNVSVKIDDNANVTDQALGQVDDCFVYVLDGGSGHTIEAGRELVTTKDIPSPGARECNLGRTPRDLGTLDYSTAKSGGTLKFVVSMTDQVTTDKPTPYTILDGSVEAQVKGGVVSLSLLVAPCNDPKDSKATKASKTCGQ
jgi:hypothetical protein